jgi:hypothetical protein
MWDACMEAGVGMDALGSTGSLVPTQEIMPQSCRRNKAANGSGAEAGCPSRAPRVRNLPLLVVSGR